MICDRAAELLPWLLNGTLEPDVQRELVEHLRACPACRWDLAATRQAWDIHGAHVPIETLIAYSFGEELHGLTMAEVQSHLEACPACRTDLELVRQDPLAEPRAGVGLEPAVSTTAARSLPGASAPQPRRARSWLLAAGISAALAGAFALGRWQTPRPHTAPAADVQVVELVPESRVERGPVSTGRVTLAAGLPATLILTTDDVTPFAAYRVELHRPGAGILWGSDQVRRSANNEFVLHLPAAAFAPGELEIRLLGRAEAGWRDVERYPVTLVPDQDETRPVTRVP